MKKSASVILGTLALVAGLTACDDGPTKDVKTCADRNGNVVDDSYCYQQPQTAQGQNPDDQIIRDVLIYHWIFGGNYQPRGNTFVYVGGGGYRPAISTTYVMRSTTEGSSIVRSGSAASYGARVGGGYGGVSRGGFGGSFSGGGE